MQCSSYCARRKPLCMNEFLERGWRRSTIYHGHVCAQCSSSVRGRGYMHTRWSGHSSTLKGNDRGSEGRPFPPAYGGLLSPSRHADSLEVYVGHVLIAGFAPKVTMCLNCVQGRLAPPADTFWSMPIWFLQFTPSVLAVVTLSPGEVGAVFANKTCVLGLSQCSATAAIPAVRREGCCTSLSTHVAG